MRLIALLLALLLSARTCLYADTIAVGALLNLSGFGARWGENARRGLVLAQEEINSQGGIGGKMLSILYEDAKSGDLKTCAAAANKLVRQDRVELLITQWTGDTNVAWPIASRAGVLTIAVSAGAPDFVKGRDLLVRVWGGDEALVERIAASMDNHRLSRPYILVSQDAYFLGLAAALRSELKRRGIVPAGDTEAASGDQDLSIEALKIKTSGADSVVSLLYISQQAAVLKNLEALRIKLPTFGSIGSDDAASLNLAGHAAEGLMVPTYLYGDDAFIRKFTERWGQAPWLGASTAYDALQLFAQVAASYSSGRARYEALLSVRDFPGVSGAISFDASGERSTQATQMLVIRDGVAASMNNP